jgi:hypothetical protein
VRIFLGEVCKSRLYGVLVHADGDIERFRRWNTVD